MNVTLSRFVVVDALNEWFKNQRSVIVQGRMWDTRELTVKDIRFVDGDVQLDCGRKMNWKGVCPDCYRATDHCTCKPFNRGTP